MADSTIPNLTAVTTPVSTDVFRVRQAADTRDKKVTRQQLHALESGELFLADAGTAGAPGIAFNGDPDTGVFRQGADVLALTAGAVEAMRFTEATGVIQAVEADVGLTAHTDSVQGAGVILSSYNVYSVVAVAGDAATLPAVFIVGTLIYIKNDDSTESMDVFPASGDNAGAGDNNAVAVAAGNFAVFFGTVADTTWTKLMGGTA